MKFHNFITEISVFCDEISSQKFQFSVMKLLCRIADRLRLGRRGEERRGERNVSAEEKGEKREKMKKNGKKWKKMEKNEKRKHTNISISFMFVFRTMADEHEFYVLCLEPP